MSLKSLLIVAGVSGVGKSTLIGRMKQDELPDLSTQLGVISPSLYSCWNGKQLNEQAKSFDTQVILHYDFLYMASIQSAIGYLPEIAHSQTDVTALTLCASVDELQHRIYLRFCRALRQFSFRPDTFKGKRLIRLYRTLNIYKDTRRTLSLYHSWSEGVLQGMSVGTHLILDCSGTKVGVAEPFDLRIVAEILEQSKT